MISFPMTLHCPFFQFTLANVYVDFLPRKTVVNELIQLLVIINVELNSTLSISQFIRKPEGIN